MELYQHWEEATEETNEDAAQLRRDFKTHAMTSYASLVHFTKVLAVNGSFDAVNKLSELGAWLSAHRSELPPEMEDAKGNRSWGSRLETPDYEDPDSVAQSDDEVDVHGLYYMGDNVIFQYFDGSFCWSDREYRTVGPVVSVRNRLMRKRGDLYRKWRTERDARLRWRGMEEFRGVTNALVHMDAGVSPRAAQSGSAPLPTQAELHACSTTTADADMGCITGTYPQG
jgi:hypothetical protein